MILADTSVWIDHFHRPDPELIRLLSLDEVGGHPFVAEELALGRIEHRGTVLSLFSRLRRFPVLTHGELMSLVEVRRLWGRGLSAVDAHLLGSAALEPNGILWTRDKHLRAAAEDLAIDTR